MNFKSIQALGFLFLLTLFSSIPLPAKLLPFYPKVETLRTEIITLIKKPNLSSLKANEETVNLSFLVNKKKQVVVINADTNSQYLETYIKKNLNYQKIKTDFVQLNKMYYIKLIFKKK